MKAGIFDIDGSLIREENGVEDVVEPLRNLASLTYHSEDFRTIVLTARSEEIREETEELLEEKEVPYDRLYMRKNREMNKPDYLFKKDRLEQLREEGFEIDFAVEDRGKVAKMFEAEGVDCLKMPETHRIRHNFFDRLRRIYPYVPSPVKKIYLSLYRRNF